MGKPNFSDEFKRDAVAQITERGYRVAEVSERLGVSQHSLYAWKRQLAKAVSGDACKDAEIRQLKRELARVTEERDILKTVPGLARLRAVETGCVMVLTGGSRPVAYWWHDTPLKNVARGHLRT
jgi:transposase